MNLHRFGSTRRDVPVIRQGTWYNEDDAPAAALAALRRGLSLGVTHIDTAEMYGSAAARTRCRRCSSSARPRTGAAATEKALTQRKDRAT